MVDYQLLMIAQNMPDHATPPARMSGGDMPMWDADMELWETYTIYSNPGYISPHTLHGDDLNSDASVDNAAISGTIGG